MDCIGNHPDFPGRKVVYCRRDCFGWVVPNLSNVELAEFYRLAYRDRRNETPADNYIDFMRKRASNQFQFISNAGSRAKFSKILDIGCGAGLLLERFRTLDCSLTGFEPDLVMANWASKNLESSAIVYNDVFSVEKATSSFDLVLMSHVLEHIPEPLKFLRNLRDTMSVDANLFIEVPNDSYKNVSLQIANKIQGLAHVSYFTPASLLRTARQAGFSCLELCTYGPPADGYWRAHEERSRLVSKLPYKLRKLLRMLPRSTDFDLTSPLSTAHPDSGIHIRAVFSPSN